MKGIILAQCLNFRLHWKKHKLSIPTIASHFVYNLLLDISIMFSVYTVKDRSSWDEVDEVFFYNSANRTDWISIFCLQFCQGHSNWSKKSCFNYCPFCFFWQIQSCVPNCTSFSNIYCVNVKTMKSWFCQNFMIVDLVLCFQLILVGVFSQSYSIVL